MNEPSQEKPSRLQQPATHARRRRLRPLFSALLSVGGFLTFPEPASAQTDADVSRPMPNVLVLVDTSGSMEYKTLGSNGKPAFPSCKYDATGTIPNGPATSEKSRWIDLVEVLTGTITNYECQRIDRGSAAFKNEYKVAASNSPYDFLYANPYHRPLSNGCAIGPGSVSSTNPAEFLATAFKYHDFANPASASCSFEQSPDGILDSYLSGIRFGLMTFDTDPAPDTGESGTYSYVFGPSHTGKPIGCSTASPMEVGARNASAPPWEGRMVSFGDPSPNAPDYQIKNQQIQQVLRASRPFGATPIAGMLADARDFLRKDTSYDPVDASKYFGPVNDPYKDCRKTAIMLLSDGQPNMDLRGHCSGNDCPFPLPEDIAHDLLLSPQPVKTYVVGFALDTLTIGANASAKTVDCSALTASDLDTTPSALCAANPDNASLQACCNLARIAMAGDDSPTRHAYFANNREQLRAGISSILAATYSPTSRTQAAFSGVAGSSTSELAPAASYRFYSGFLPLSGQVWAGSIQRERWKCDDTQKAVRVPPSANAGDLFARNLNSQSGRGRTFYTVQAGTSADGKVHSEYSVRPNLGGTNPDGVGAVSGTTNGASAITFVANTSPESMGIYTPTACNDTVNGVATSLPAAQCRDKYLKWLVGAPNTPYADRCKPPADSKLEDTCNLLGDIFHATPRIVNNPRELTRDDTYQAFIGNYATRPMMLYTSSNDGMLHAFKVASNVKDDSEKVDVLKNNELWAFIPPQVLPYIAGEYPYTHQMLLDGVSVVKDVVARKTSGAYPYVFERTLADAQAGASANTTWRTILVQGFGGTYPGYFALDVTNPDPTMTLNEEAGGPKFLWQLTRDTNGKALFGIGGATPTITTLLLEDDGQDAREVPVAILPGGSGGSGNAGPNNGTPGCARATTDFAKFGSYPPRPRVPCYTDPDVLGSRSLTIVRLDNGKIIRSFWRSKLEAPSGIRSRVIESPLDSPITGEPVAFPADVGSVADRIFVGDQDGTLWKIDVSNKSPDKWTMSLFWDAYPAVEIHSKKADWNSGQPIATAPVLSVDSKGNLTLAVSTGGQGSIGSASGSLNYLWALRDLPNATRQLLPDMLWVQQFEGGERVTGPLSLFNSYLYFSTLKPPQAGSNCKTTDGSFIWGMHYMIPRDGEGGALPPDRTVGGQAAPFLKKFSSTDQFVSDTTLLGTDAKNQAVIFGVTVAQVPTCFAEDVVADSVLGSHTRISNATPGDFQLVFQTGSAALSTGGKADAAAPAGAAAITLPKLSTPTRVEAWASIVE